MPSNYLKILNVPADLEQDYYIETISAAPGSLVQTYQHRDTRGPRVIAEEFARRLANVSGAYSVATVYIGAERHPAATVAID